MIYKSTVTGGIAEKCEGLVRMLITVNCFVEAYPYAPLNATSISNRFL
jgi:hypothetical protein